MSVAALGRTAQSPVNASALKDHVDQRGASVFLVFASGTHKHVLYAHVVFGTHRYALEQLDGFLK